MKPTDILTDLKDKINGYECTFTPKDDEFLDSLGLKKLTGLRNSADNYAPETELDRLQQLAGHTGCNESAMQDFVCEKDGLQVKIFVICGCWCVGQDACHNGQLITR